MSTYSKSKLKYNKVSIFAASSITASEDNHGKDNDNNQPNDQRRSDDA